MYLYLNTGLKWDSQFCDSLSFAFIVFCQPNVAAARLGWSGHDIIGSWRFDSNFTRSRRIKNTDDQLYRTIGHFGAAWFWAWWCWVILGLSVSMGLDALLEISLFKNIDLTYKRPLSMAVWLSYFSFNF